MRKIIIIILLVVSPALLAAEEKPVSSVEPDESPVLLEENHGVLIVETSRESQPIFNVLDIVVSYNGEQIKNKFHLKKLLKEQSPNTTYPLGIIRDKKLLNLIVSSGPWHVDLHDMTQEAYATLITDQHGQSVSKQERKRQLGMLQQYLKGRPYRTPNNQGSDRDRKPERHSDGKDNQS